MNQEKNKAIFIDKDGTLIRDIPYNVDPALIDIEPSVSSGLQMLAEAGYELVIISNQSGVARGYFEASALDKVRLRIQQLLATSNVQLSGFYYCPHFSGGTVPEFSIDCICRKPKPGMILQAAEDLDISLANSWMIGDILHDVEAGNRAGCRTILLDNGNETEWELASERVPDYIVESVKEAALVILHQNHATGD